jgi:hypothetical protein
MSKLINSHNGFDPLEEVWLGGTYPAEFYEHLDGPVRDAFQTITEWTNEDLSKIHKALEEHGITVRRPEYGSIDDCIDSNGNLYKPVVAPRDETIVIGNTMYHLRSNFKKNPWQGALDHYYANDEDVREYEEGTPWACVAPPCVVRVGKDIYIDYVYHEHVWGMVTEPLVELAKDYRVHVSMIDGHSDSVFCPVNEGLILTTEYKETYNKTFPNWNVHHITHSNRATPVELAIPHGFHRWNIKDDRIGANNEFAHHIEEKAQEWVGDWEETVFDVNLLILDDKTIFSVGEDEDTFEFLTKQGYNVHAFDFRCRNFWDAGMHCLTNDIRRKGECQDYFPDRQGPYLDWLVDDE